LTSGEPTNSVPEGETTPAGKSGRRRPRPFRVSVQSKLLLMLLVCSILSVAVVGVIGFLRARNDLTNSLVAYTRGSTVPEALQAFITGFDHQQSLVPYARIIRYGAEEIVEYDSQVPERMAFLVAGRVWLTATAEDGSVVPVSTLSEGSFLGVTALTRQPNPGGVYAMAEVTTLEIDRERLEQLVMGKPMLLQDLGRLIDERQDKVLQATRRGRNSGEAVER